MIKYNEKIKNKSREYLITNAIHNLTQNRFDSYIINKDYFDSISNYFNELINKYYFKSNSNRINFENNFKKSKEHWVKLFDNYSLKKLPSQLKVLYLCGPEPINDLNIFLSNGIIPSNIWAVEKDKSIYRDALKNLQNNNKSIKLHRGSLNELFKLTNQTFDIIYFDSTKPIISRSGNPLTTLKEIFINTRLSHLSALITNFAEPNIKENNLEWDKIFATWFALRPQEECPQLECNLEFNVEKNYEIEKYSNFIKKHIFEYYDIFLTHFITNFASEMIPFGQLLSLRSIRSKYFWDNKELKRLLETNEIEGNSIKDFLYTIPHSDLAPEEYPLLNWVKLIEDNFETQHPIRQFINIGFEEIKFKDAIMICSLLKKFETGYSGFNTLTQDICSENLKDLLSTIDFFDRNERLTCDIPMKNLIIDLLFGQYGFPYILNVKKSKMIKYKAKKTWMFSNIFIFDQCRYLYDFVPSIELIETFFSNLGNQVVIRSCIDGIRRNNCYLNNNFFKWGFIEGWQFSDILTLSKRINFNQILD